ncbi:MAG: hypothetical protein R3C28_30930 [Pirellulaceae bacterium]
MSRHKQNKPKRIRNSSPHPVVGRRFRYGSSLSQRTRGMDKNQKFPFSPPEDWHEPQGEATQGKSYRIVVQSPGPGFRHVVTPEEIRERLAQLPDEMVAPLEVVQLSRMTRKKKSFPCYGMQWGSALYLYPIEEGMTEYYGRPPQPAQLNEAKMYGGRWSESAPGEWSLEWTEEAIKDFYLNNILIHELGHLLDDRNTSYIDRERYAEWFAIEHGYRRVNESGTAPASRGKRKTIRRHHAS